VASSSRLLDFQLGDDVVVQVVEATSDRIAPGEPTLELRISTELLLKRVVALLEKHIGWLFPVQHGKDDPRYPSRVGVLVVNTTWSVPSA
jgi:hypothetical protein